MPADPPHEYVTRGGLKLRHALDAFSLDVRGLTCADLGCHMGGFTDCLLRAGAARVYAVDTAHGQLAWTLRQDPRVVVMERTNALHAAPPPGGVDLVAADLGWTPQHRLVPAALRWLRPGGRILSLIKPHYEAAALGPRSAPPGGVLAADEAERVVHRVLGEMPTLGAAVLGLTRSPIAGGVTRRRGAAGNAEWLALLAAHSTSTLDDSGPSGG